MSCMVDQLFPLPLTAFEKFMLTDDRPDYPMTFTLCYEFSGQIDRQAWEQAYHLALDRHPMLTACVSRRSRWVPAPQRRDIHWVDADEALLPETEESLNLQAEHGLRVWMQPTAERVRLVTQFHHACCDGIGALQFQGDWLACYHALVHQQEPQLTTLQPELLKSRERTRWRNPAGGSLSLWQIMHAHGREFYQYYMKRVVPITGQQSSAPTPFPGILHVTLTREQTAALMKAAKQEGVQMNDLLLRDLFLTLQEWNQHVLRGRQCFTVTMPTSLRDRNDARMPSANIVSHSFIDVTAADCQQTGQLLRHVSLRTSEIRRWNMGQLTLSGLKMMRKIPWFYQVLTSPRICHATTVLSNLGDPTRRFYRNLPHVGGQVISGGMTLEHFYGVPPLRPLTRANFLLSMYAGRLTISLRGDRNWFSPEQAQKMLDLYQHKILRSAESTARLEPQPRAEESITKDAEIVEK